MSKQVRIIALFVFIVFLLNGCVGNDRMSITTENIANRQLPMVENTTGNDQEEEITFDLLQLNIKYSGSPYEEVHNNVPFFGDEEKIIDAFEEYSPLDSLGRCGAAYANICIERMPTESRGAIGHIRPSGWHTVKYNDLIEGNYLYNRCHLIAFELAGENANEKNLITGTRYMNVTGMLPFENKVADYVKATHNHVLYRVTPVFEGDNLVADGVLMEAYSVEDSGAGIQFCVFVFNVQPGIGMDYATGDSWLINNDTEMSGRSSNDVEHLLPEEAKEEETQVNNILSGNDEKTEEYILNTNTHRFHYPYCRSVSDMKEKNKQTIYGTRDEIVEMGYTPCGNCKP